MQTLGCALNKVEVDAAMAEMDKDGSGGVDFDEFYTWWCSDTKKKSIPVSCKPSFCPAGHDHSEMHGSRLMGVCFVDPAASSYFDIVPL